MYRRSLMFVFATVACSESSGGDGSTAAGTADAGSTGAATSSVADATTDGDDTTAAAEEGSASADSGEPFEDLDATPEDFVCLLDWDKVGSFRIVNLLGHTDEALAVAQSRDGGTYPVGTIIQLVPSEAMVKRAVGWSEMTNDWEFFALDVSQAGTEIADRGMTNVVNQFGANCFGCHSGAAAQWDMICAEDHGCDPIGLPPRIFESLQNNDPRCK